MGCAWYNGGGRSYSRARGCQMSQSLRTQAAQLVETSPSPPPPLFPAPPGGGRSYSRARGCQMSQSLRTQASQLVEPSSSPHHLLFRAALAGTGRCLPERVVRNEDFPPSLGTSDEWIRTRTGIRERRIAGP